MTTALHHSLVRRILATSACMFVAGMLATACASDRAIREAETALAAARDAHADYLAPGEFRSAENWLAEARVRLRAADHDSARVCAAHSVSKSEMALTNALAYGRPVQNVPVSPIVDENPTPPAADDHGEPAP